MKDGTYIKNFVGWGIQKEKIHGKNIVLYPKEREVWFVSWGVNIGSETDGKTNYLRPVIVIKKIGSIYFCIPLTTKHKNNKYHYDLGILGGKKSSVLLSQAKTIDVKRFSHKMCRLEKKKFLYIKKTMREIYLS